jgi:hypothetical protein
MASTRGKKGRKLVRKSLRLLENHKRLFIFPILGYLCKFLIYVAVVTPFIHSREQLEAVNRLPGSQVVLLIVVFMLMLFVINVLLFFFNTAIIANLIHFIRFKREASIRFGFQQAFGNFFRVYMWAWYSGTVGMIFNLLPRNSQYKLKLQKLLRKNHWKLASYFSLALVMDQKVGPHAALKRSGELMNELWGENLRPNFNYLGLFACLELPCFIGFILACIYGGHATIIGVGITAGFFILLSSSFYQMISTTLRTVSYCYAQYKVTPDIFDAEIIKRFFVKRL